MIYYVVCACLVSVFFLLSGLKHVVFVVFTFLAPCCAVRTEKPCSFRFSLNYLQERSCLEVLFTLRCILVSLKKQEVLTFPSTWVHLCFWWGPCCSSFKCCMWCCIFVCFVFLGPVSCILPVSLDCPFLITLRVSLTYIKTKVLLHQSQVIWLSCLGMFRSLVSNNFKLFGCPIFLQ